MAVAIAVGCSDSGEPPGPGVGGQTSAGKGGGAGSAGTAGATAGGTSGSAGTPALGGTAGTAGDSGGTAGASGGSAGTGGSAGSGGSAGGVTAFTPCNTAPAAPAPDLVLGEAIDGFEGMETAGQMVGVPGEPDVLYVIGHRDGAVHVVQNGTALPAPLVTVSVASGGNNEQGLLSMALHPDFATNQLFYLFYTADNGDLTIDEFMRTSPTAATFVQNTFSTPRVGGGEFHNGGSITFNPTDATKSLFFSPGNTSGNTAGDEEGTVGRILRIDVTSKAYSTYAWGLRNPYRMSVDRLTGNMYIGDVANGPGGTVIVNENEEGADYGYQVNNDQNNDINDGIHREGGGAAIIGGFVYRGNKIPGACGRYFFGLHEGGVIKSLVFEGGQATDIITHAELDLPTGNLTTFGEDGEGELYVGSMNNQIWKIEAAP